MCGVMGYGVSFEGFLSNTGQQWWPRGGCRWQDALPPPLLTHTKDGQDSPSRWDTRAFLRMFLPRSTSLSVALVQRRILKQGWGAHSESRCYLLASPILLRDPSPLKYCRAGTHHWPCRKNIMSSTVIGSQTKCAPSKPVSA